MKKGFLFFLLTLLVSTVSMAQGAKASPAATAKGKGGDADITIKYAQPSVKGRKIWGGLVPYDQVWRTGANNATTIEFSKAVKIEGKDLAAGKYALFTIPTEGGKWTIIFNKKADQWGAYNYKADDDALRVDVQAKTSDVAVEAMTFSIAENTVTLAWEKLTVGFMVK
jgi:hypothetical protein